MGPLFKRYRVGIPTESGRAYFDIVGEIVPSYYAFWTTLRLPDTQRIEFPPVFKVEELTGTAAV